MKVQNIVIISKTRHLHTFLLIVQQGGVRKIFLYMLK